MTAFVLQKFIGIVVTATIIGALAFDQNPSGGVVATASVDRLSAFGRYAAVRLDHYDFTYLSDISYSRQPSGYGAAVANIFISYARDDDLPPPDKPDRKGFVTFLDDAVRYEFKELGPERPKIWRDTKRIADGDQFTPEIEEALKSASILLVVLSPNWMASPWCRRELDAFAK